MALTDTAIKHAKPGNKTRKLYDSGGLYLEVSPKGGTWWRFKYRFSGKEKRLSLGVYPDVSLKDARDRREDAENVLFQLAEANPRLYASYDWRNAAMRRGTLSAAHRLLNLAANGVFEVKGTDRWHLASQLGGLMDKHPELRTHVNTLLKDGVATPGLEQLARAIAENPDVEVLLLLIKIEIEYNQPFISWQTIERVVTEHIPSENWKGAYDVVPVPVIDLRRELLAMTTDGEPNNAAARCLNQIDKIRDQYGVPDSEPRHPDLASGNPWPIMVPDPDFSEA